MSNLLQHAEDELNRIGMTEDSKDEMNVAMRKHILHMVNEFANEGHSGFSASYALGLLQKLLAFKPLSPLTGADDEWIKHEYGTEPFFQNKRRSSVFKNSDGYCYDIDAKVYWEWTGTKEEPHKSYYSNHEARMPVTFPYVVPDEPIYEYRYSSAEPPAPAQTEEGLL